MKTNTSSLFISAFAVGTALFIFASRAEMESANTKSLLTAAGFRIRTPEAPQQKEIYAALPAYPV